MNARLLKLLAFFGGQIKRVAHLNGDFLVMSLGVLAMAAGAWWIYPPAGLLVGGALLVADVLFGRILECRLAMRKKDGDE